MRGIVGEERPEDFSFLIQIKVCSRSALRIREGVLLTLFPAILLTGFRTASKLL
jgi:hypothetical protein